MVVNLKNTASSFVDRTATVNQYFSEVRKFDTLTTEQEQQLFAIINGDYSQYEKEMAAKKIAECNQKFVIAVARHYAPADKFLDCVSEGTIGLMQAIQAFDPSNGVKFITFAVHYVRREITQYLRDDEPSIRKTNISKTFHTAAQARNEFIQAEERDPTPDELAEVLKEKYDVEIKDTNDLRDMTIMSIDEAVSDDEDETFMGDSKLFNSYTAASNGYETIEENSYNSFLLESLFKVLSPREQKVISMCFGIGYERTYECSEIASEMGLTSERIRQMKANIIERLQKEFMKKSKVI